MNSLKVETRKDKIIKNCKNDKVLIDIFNNFIKQQNYKYMLLN